MRKNDNTEIFLVYFVIHRENSTLPSENKSLEFSIVGVHDQLIC